MLILRNLIEFAVIVLLWIGLQVLIDNSAISRTGMMLAVLLATWAKSAFFGSENLRQLWKASSENMAYHQFMLLMLVNMSQIILSFGLDYYCLYSLNPGSFSSISTALTRPELVFEFIYFSVLNFTFFGYGDITPQTVPAKLVTMTEVVLAFVTVIFLLSDFISLKESLSPAKKP